MEINKPITIIIILVVFLIVLFLFVLPKYQESNRLQASLLSKQAEYNGQALYYENIYTVAKSIESRQDVLQKVDSALPADSSVAPLVYFFQKKASDNGLTIKSMVFLQAAPLAQTKAGVDTAQKDVKDVVFTLEMLGNYEGFKQFLSSLENSARLFEVSTISFTSLASLQSILQPKNSANMYSFKMEVKTHSY